MLHLKYLNNIYADSSKEQKKILRFVAQINVQKYSYTFFFFFITDAIIQNLLVGGGRCKRLSKVSCHTRQVYFPKILSLNISDFIVRNVATLLFF